MSTLKKVVCLYAIKDVWCECGERLTTNAHSNHVKQMIHPIKLAFDLKFSADDNTNIFGENPQMRNALRAKYVNSKNACKERLFTSWALHMLRILISKFHKFSKRYETLCRRSLLTCTTKTMRRVRFDVGNECGKWKCFYLRCYCFSQYCSNHKDQKAHEKLLSEIVFLPEKLHKSIVMMEGNKCHKCLMSKKKSLWWLMEDVRNIFYKSWCFNRKILICFLRNPLNMPKLSIFIFNVINCLPSKRHAGSNKLN